MKPITYLSAARRPTLSVLFVTMLVFTGIAHADGRAHKGKTGHLKITAPTAVGGTVLQPGDYDVREVRSSDEQMVEFVRVTIDPYPPDGIWSYEEEVVARVKSTEQALSAPPKHTHLELVPQTESAAALFIRGDTFEYRFVPSRATSDAGAMSSPTDDAQQHFRSHEAGEK